MVWPAVKAVAVASLMALAHGLGVADPIEQRNDDKFAIEGAKIGYVVNARKPVRYIVTTGQQLQIQDATETQVPVALTTQDHVDFQFSSADLALSVDDFKDRFLQPAVSALANKIDFSGLSLYNQISNAVGTPGTVPNTLLTYLLAGVQLDNNAAPMDEMRHIVVSPKMQAYIVDALKGLFQQSTAIAQQYIKGTMGISGGFNWAMDQNVPTHTVGPLGGTPLVDGAGQIGTGLLTKGWTAAAASRLLEGDVFTIAGVYGVNPQSRQSTGDLQQFVVRANFASDGSGNGTVTISPSIITSGAYQTVTGSPADAAAITVLGAANTASVQGLAFHRDAFTLVTADLPVPKGVDMGARVADKQLGISLRVVRQYDINSDHFPTRIDVLYGWATLRPELAVRIAA